jgi:hypothetical protein
MSYGGYAESGIFVLKSRAQYQFHLRGASKIARDSSVVSILRNLTTNNTIDICGANIGVDANTRFVIESAATLLLEPGTYTWQSRVKTPGGAAIGDSSLQGEWAQTPSREMVTRGAKEAFSLMSGTNGLNVFARGYVSCQLVPGESIDASVIVTDLTTGQSLPPSQLHWDQPLTDKEIGAVPYLLAAGHTYQAKVKIVYSGNAQVSCRLAQAF